jgi:hypothetical protein
VACRGIVRLVVLSSVICDGRGVDNDGHDFHEFDDPDADCGFGRSCDSDDQQCFAGQRFD